MRTLNAYNFLTLNGFFRGPREDTNWHTHGGEEEQYSVESLQGLREVYWVPETRMVL